MSRYIDADSITEELRAWQEAMKKRGNETMADGKDEITCAKL